MAAAIDDVIVEIEKAAVRPPVDDLTLLYIQCQDGIKLASCRLHANFVFQSHLITVCHEILMGFHCLDARVS